MKIETGRHNAEKVAREYSERLRESGRNKTTAANKAAEDAPSHAVKISSEAKTLSKAKAAIEAQPDMRDNLVKDIKDKVDAGKYAVNTDALAKKMLEGLKR